MRRWTDLNLGSPILTRNESPTPQVGAPSYQHSSAQQLPEHQALVAIVETGSFSEAARALGVTKSCVSKQISRLEERLGVRLLQRTTRNVHLTEVGERFYQRCVHILDQIQGAEEGASHMHAVPSGRLRLAAPATFAQHVLTPLICQFLQTWPAISADLVFTTDGLDIVGDGLDLAIQFGDLPDSTLVARRLMTTRNVLCASPQYLAQHGAPTHPRELERHRCLVVRSQEPGAAWRLVADGVEHLFRPSQGPVTCNHAAGLLLAAQAGLGLTMLPDYLAETALDDKTLVPVLEAWTRLETPVWLVYPHPDLSAKTRCFIDFLVSRLELES